MGEYAKNLRGESVKIGTCESMYYLRADQAHLVRHEHGNVDPVADRYDIRFRFPFPDEDAIAPGDFADHARAIWLTPAEPVEGFDHGRVQFISSAGYNVMLPCPEDPISGDSPEYTVHRNGFPGSVGIYAQKHLRVRHAVPRRQVPRL